MRLEQTSLQTGKKSQQKYKGFFSSDKIKIFGESFVMQLFFCEDLLYI